jgi:hypothetical protein
VLEVYVPREEERPLRGGGDELEDLVAPAELLRGAPEEVDLIHLGGDETTARTCR